MDKITVVEFQYEANSFEICLIVKRYTTQYMKLKYNLHKFNKHETFELRC